MGHHHQQKSDKEYARKRHPEVSDTDDWRSAEPNAAFALSPSAIMKLQHTIGNQAVQRLIGGEMQHNDGNTHVRRDTGGGGTQKEASLPSFVATITFDRQGKIKGKSRIAGHEGKVEVQALSIEPGRPSRNRDEPTPTRIVIARDVDDSSPLFTRAHLDGDPVKTAKFELIRRNGEGKVEIVQTLDFSDGVISSYSLGGGERPTESIGMEFKGKPS